MIKGERLPAPLSYDLNLNYFMYFRTASSSCSAATMSLRNRTIVSTMLIRVSFWCKENSPLAYLSAACRQRHMHNPFSRLMEVYGLM